MECALEKAARIFVTLSPREGNRCVVRRFLFTISAHPVTKVHMRFAVHLPCHLADRWRAFGY